MLRWVWYVFVRKRVARVSLATLTEELRTKHNVSKDVMGVVVELDPKPRPPFGWKVGDVILEAEGVTVSSLEHIVRSAEKVKNAGRKSVLLRILDRKGDVRSAATPVY